MTDIQYFGHTQHFRIQFLDEIRDKISATVIVNTTMSIDTRHCSGDLHELVMHCIMLVELMIMIGV